MAHATGDRTGWDKIVDMLKPRLEHTLREHGGRVIFATPALGDVLKYAVRRFGAKSFANAVLIGGGYAKFPRTLFRSGPVGDKIQRIANEAVDEFAQAIAKQGLDASPEELEGTVDQIIARLLGKAEGEAQEGRENVAMMVIVHTIKEGDVVRRESHHRNCVDLPPLVLTETFRDGRGQMRERKKSNPALREMPRDHAKAQGIPEHVDCMPIFETEKTAQAPTQKTGGKKKPAEIIAELTEAERKKLLGKIGGLTPAERAHVMHEFEERLTSVEELRGVIALSDTMPLPDAVGLLKDRFQERVEGAARWVWGRAQAAQADLRTAAEQSAQALAASRERLAATKARLRAKLG